MNRRWERLVKLDRPAEIGDQIDRALQRCWVRSQPVYIMMPSDMIDKEIEGACLSTPIDLAEPTAELNSEREDCVVDAVLKSLYAARNPVVLVDHYALRHRVLEQVRDLIEKTQLSVFVTPMGKGAVNEDSPSYGGLYAGVGSEPAVAREQVEASDLVLTIGGLKSDVNTAGFTCRTSQLRTIDLHPSYCKVRHSEYPGVSMRGVLRKIVERIDPQKLARPTLPRPLLPQAMPHQSTLPNEAAHHNGDNPQDITHAFFWRRISGYLKKDDIVVTETGTSSIGIWETKFPPGATGITQALWGSIGWSVGAAQGAALAAKDAGVDRRTVLFVGDGSFQLTAQEITTMIRHKLKITIFLIYNEGFTVERFIHGMDAEYNDITRWQYTDVPRVLGASDKEVRTFVVKTRDDFEDLLADKGFNNPDTGGLQFVEVWMPKKDAPKALKTVAEILTKNNASIAKAVD